MKKFLLMLLLAIGALSLAACGDREDDEDTFTIAFIASTFENPFFLDIEEGILNILDQYDEFEYVSVGSDNDAAKQDNDIDDMIALGVDLILLNPVDSTTVAAQVEEAQAAGIPVITVDRGAEGVEVLAHVASDNVFGGEIAGQYLLDAWDGTSPVLQLLGQPGASAAIDRQEGFENIWDLEDIDQTITANWSRAEAQDVTEAFLAAQDNPETVFIFAANDEMALGAVEAILESTTASIETSVVVGFDAIPDALDSIDDDELRATVQQQPVLMGELAAQAAVDYLNGEDIEASVDVEVVLITKED